MSQSNPLPHRDGYHLEFRRYRRGKDGRVMDAYRYGLRGWPMWFRDTKGD